MHVLEFDCYKIYYANEDSFIVLTFFNTTENLVMLISQLARVLPK